MLLEQKQYDLLFTNDAKRHGIANPFHYWPNGVVPIKFHPALSQRLKDVVISAMAYIMSVSCIRFDFMPHFANDYVMVSKDPDGGCLSAIGNSRMGEQILRLSEACERGNLIHELLHTLGMLHM